MSDIHKTYEIRCPVYGFIEISDWEREIISQPAFQRLKRVRQLAWTDQVYPGAMHTRFEHSLGVMHMATLLYEGIIKRSRDILVSEFGYNEAGLERHHVLVRLAALLHDVGHAPFSHVSEDLLPKRPDEEGRYKHEHYSTAIVRNQLADAIKNHPANMNYDFTAEDVAGLLEGGAQAGQAIFWRDLISGQMDADRMDYLLRDSLHAGVDYGRYDWRRLLNTVKAVPGGEGGAPRVGVDEGGWHAAEGLILARYFMFTQVYFHKTRVAFDHHLQQTLNEILPSGCFPTPIDECLDEYLSWDDWKVLGALANGEGGEHGRRLSNRDHYREIVHTPETPNAADLKRLDQWREALGDLLAVERSAEKSWYRVGPTGILVSSKNPGEGAKPLSTYSSVVGNIEPIRQIRLYVRAEHKPEAMKRLESLGGETK